MATNDKLHVLSKAFLKLRSEDEIQNFLKDMFTKSELEELSKRFEIAILLNDSKQYTEVERLTGASSATISKVSSSLKYGFDGLKMALERLKK